MNNQSKFAVAYRQATDDLMEAVAAFNPIRWLDSAAHNALLAENAAANIIEHTLALKLIRSIESARPMVLA
jgi:hypothetical protein